MEELNIAWSLIEVSTIQSLKSNIKLFSKPTNLGISKCNQVFLKPYSSWCILRSYFSTTRNIRRVLLYGKKLHIAWCNETINDSTVYNPYTTHDRDSLYIDKFSIVLNWVPFPYIASTPFFSLIITMICTYIQLNLLWRQCNAIHFLMWVSTQHARRQQTVKSKTRSPPSLL